MFKPFFIHRNHSPGKLPSKVIRGFTAYIEPDNDPQYVKMQVAMCSPNDQFSKKLGRWYALQSDMALVRKQDLPAVLAQLNRLLNLFLSSKPQPEQYEIAQFYYVWKYVL
jgi:hypothetical protein